MLDFFIILSYSLAIRYSEMSQYGSITQTFERNIGSKASAFKSFFTIRRRRYYKHKCITSKAGILVLVWSFVLSLMYYLLYHTLDLEIYAIANDNRVVIAHFVVKALVFSFFPFAGFLVITNLTDSRVFSVV